MELKSSCHTIRQFENILKELVKNDMARVVKKDNLKYQVDTAKEWAIVYQVYVGQGGDYAVNIRCWYDTERDWASI
jgi:glutaredoxin-related protein